MTTVILNPTRIIAAMGPMNTKSSQSSESIQQLQGKRVQQHSHTYQSTINKAHTSKVVIRWYTVPTVFFNFLDRRSYILMLQTPAILLQAVSQKAWSLSC